MFNLKKSLIPLPKHIEERHGSVMLASVGVPLFSVVEVSGDALAAEGADIIRQRLADMAAISSEAKKDCYRIILITNPSDPVFDGIDSDEAYYIDAEDKEAVLCGKFGAGTFYAAITFVDMMYKAGDDVFLQKAYIKDYPDFKYRGQFMECRYGSEFMTKENWFEVIDKLASMKSNQLAIGIYGCWSMQYDGRPTEYLYVPLTRYPFLKTPKNIKYFSVTENKWIHKDNLLPSMFEQDYLGEVISYGKQKNVTVKPLFNSLGHNTLLPKHFPEAAAKDEDGNPKACGFCTQNDKTYEVMFSIYDEIIERYLRPNDITDIMIGLDEVGESYICHCKECTNKAHSELMVEYIIKLCRHLKAEGMKRIYIYHDMLYNNFDIVKEDLRDRFVKEDIYDEVVIDWWTYEDPSKLFWSKPEGVNNLFHSVMKPFTGYFNWIIPTDHNSNIRACVKMAKELNFEGVESYGSYDNCYDKNYLTLADVSWNSRQTDNSDEFDERYAYRVAPHNPHGAYVAISNLKDIMIDETHNKYMNRVCHDFEYYYYSYNRPNMPYPQNFPGAAYGKIAENEKEYMTYFRLLMHKSESALDFFENCGSFSKLCSTWRLTAKHYYTISNEYLALYGLHKSYCQGLVDEYDAIRELDRLILQRESLMELAESVKTEHNVYMYLRNMTIFRQLLIDLKTAFTNAAQSRKRFEWNIADWGNITSQTFDFLR